MEKLNPFRDELKQMSDQDVLKAIHSEREARQMERLELAFEESGRRRLWEFAASPPALSALVAAALMARKQS